MVTIKEGCTLTALASGTERYTTQNGTNITLALSTDPEEVHLSAGRYQGPSRRQYSAAEGRGGDRGVLSRVDGSTLTL